MKAVWVWAYFYIFGIFRYFSFNRNTKVPADTIMASVAAHTDIVQTVASMPQAHLQLCLGTMQEKTPPHKPTLLNPRKPHPSRNWLHQIPELALSPKP